tara:strand:- start:176 stop:1102 length:927 start_codon:yes stop_codon:yes gene_type:complete
MSKVVITHAISEKAIQLLKNQGYKVQVGGSLKGADAVLSLLKDRIGAKEMKSAGSQLQVVSNYAVGVDNIDLDAAQKAGIVVTNTPDVLTTAVANHTMALIFALTRRIVEADKFVRKGKFKGWEPDLMIGTEMQGKTLGIVGHGRIGCEVASKAQQALGMKVLYYDTLRDKKREKKCGISFSSLTGLLKRVDLLSLHVPLLPDTHHLISLKELKMMKQTSYIVNTSRGPVIDEKALVSSLKRGAIAGAALDVFEKEPKLTSGLSKLDNVVLTPHIASATREARQEMAIVAAKNIINVLSKKRIINRVV